MGKRGPLPKNHYSKVLSGTEPITKEFTEIVNSPTYIPAMPDHFIEKERKAWSETINLLKPLRIINPSDKAIIGAYCCAFIRWQDAENEIHKAKTVKEGYCTINGKGKITGISPFIRISREAQQDMVYYAAQLGMTPTSRIKIASCVGDAIKKNPFLKLKEGNVDPQ
jgi:P27 family predicted phage terminase small subunit